MVGTGARTGHRSNALSFRCRIASIPPVREAGGITAMAVWYAGFIMMPRSPLRNQYGYVVTSGQRGEKSKVRD